VSLTAGARRWRDASDHTIGVAIEYPDALGRRQRELDELDRATVGCFARWRKALCLHRCRPDIEPDSIGMRHLVFIGRASWLCTRTSGMAPAGRSSIRP
jgi:hypothetical protein